MPGNQSHHAEHAAGDRQPSRLREAAAFAARRRDPAARDMRVTMIATAVDSSSAGICATRPSPIVSSVYDARRIAEAQAVAERADRQPADDVDQQNQNAGGRIAAHELAGTVHRAVEVGLGAHLGAALPRLVLIDQAGIQIGVDRHLLARHRIEGKARADLGDAAGALGDDHEVDDGQNREHDDADRVVAADDELAEGLDDVPGGAGALMAVQQHHTRRGDVQRQAQQRREQQQGREDAEVERPCDVDDRHHHQQRQRDIEGEQHVERERRQRQHDHRQHRQQQQRRADAPLQHAAQTCSAHARGAGVIQCQFSHSHRGSNSRAASRRRNAGASTAHANATPVTEFGRRRSSGSSMCGGAGATPAPRRAARS